MNNSIGQCLICKKEYTSTHVEYQPGEKMYVCLSCLERAKHHFVWICVQCGKVYFRSKDLVISRLQMSGMEHASALSHGVPLIQGIDACIECDPASITEYVYSGIQEKVV